MYTAGLVTSAMALLALREMATCSAPPDLVLANLTRHTGLLWALAALVFSVTYGISIFVWSGWVQYFLVFTIFAGLSLFLSRLLTDDHEAGRHDPKLARLGLTLAGYEPDDSGAWAGEHVIVFRGLAMAVVASYALKACGGPHRRPTRDDRQWFRTDGLMFHVNP